MSRDGGTRLHCLRPLSEAPAPSKRHGAENGDGRGRTADAISRALVGLLRTRTGRGPTQARTAISSDLAIVTLGDYLTAAEQTLVSEGESALATRFRTALNEGMRPEAVALVEELTGKRVVAYLTAHQTDPDVSIIAFHFGPSARVEEGNESGSLRRIGWPAPARAADPDRGGLRPRLGSPDGR